MVKGRGYSSVEIDNRVDELFPMVHVVIEQLICQSMAELVSVVFNGRIILTYLNLFHHDEDGSGGYLQILTQTLYPDAISFFCPVRYGQLIYALETTR